MITLHHLAYSRSLRVLWLLEEIGVDFELVRYDRTGDMRAPPELAEVHPLGKAPVIVDGDLVMAESSAILRHIDAHYGNGGLTPPQGTKAHAVHDEWLDYVESSAAMPIMTTLIGMRTGGLGDGMAAFVRPQLARTLDYIDAGIGEGPFLMGERLMLADMQMIYMVAVARSAGLLDGHPRIGAYLDRLMRQPSFQRAAARGGPLIPPAR